MDLANTSLASAFFICFLIRCDMWISLMEIETEDICSIARVL